MTPGNRAPRRALSLVADDTLVLQVESRLAPLVERWLPRYLEEPPPRVTPRATIEAVVAAREAPRPAGAATLALGSVQAWLPDEPGPVQLHGLDAGSLGTVDLTSHRATLWADPAAAGSAADLYSMLTVTSALLLASLGRALVHAAGVVAPEGGAWLLVGDARAGKSTTCANLVRVGWAYLSDDQVVLSSQPSGVVVEGWLRPFHLDRGWVEGDEGESGEDRWEVLPSVLAPDGRRRSAPLAGLLFPSVHRDTPTRLAPLSPGEALAGLVRQSPWLLAWRATAPAMLALLRHAAGAASYRLHLGADTYRDGDGLSARLAALQGTVP